MDLQKSKKRDSFNSSYALKSDSFVFLLTSDLKKLTCSMELLINRSSFFLKIFECFDENDKVNKDQSKLIQLIPIVYLDYHSSQIERIIEFLKNDQMSLESVSLCLFV